ncbi:unnamed protein product [Urochloa decumbens]|uniref:F-box domain-containing protein n=1 Tax=Urochloa decumbens TaxID=240449 RepID=A0ABC8WTW5_9POAL
MSPRPSSSSPAAAPQLPEDLILCSILPLLPVRSLARFAAVCKAWRDLILRDAAFPALQARSPSPASSALARFHNGRFEILGAAAAAKSVAPDPSLSFLAVDRSGNQYEQLDLCACAGGLLCMTAVHVESRRRVLFICNPTTENVHRILYDCPLGVPGLAYDPAAAERGYDVVVAAKEGWEACRFCRYSSRAAGSGWRTTRGAATLRLAPYESLQPKPACAGGRVHWFTSAGNIVWHDVAAVRSGVLPPPPPPCQSSGNMDLAAWRGRLRLACATAAGLGVWELASYGGNGAAARWEAVHWRSWSAIPGVIAPERCFLWSVVPAGMVCGGEDALGLALRCAHVAPPERRARGEAYVWVRALVRYDWCTGATVVAAKLAGKEIHDGLGTVVGYHSSLAPLPRLNFDA